EGTLTRVEVAQPPRLFAVRTKAGDDVQVAIGDDAQVTFADTARGYSDAPRLADLRPGMAVRFVYDAEKVGAITVTEVPLALVAARHKAGGTPAATNANEQRLVKARVTDVNTGRSEIRAEIGGREETLPVRDRQQLRQARRGEVVILTIAGDGTVTSIHSAALAGRVVRV